MALIKLHPSAPTLLIIDEGFGCMDEDHLDKTIEFFQTIIKQKVILISHIQELKTIGKSIPINQLPTGSYINNCEKM